MKIKEALIEANLILKKNLIRSSNLDSEILMSKAIRKDRKYIILNPKENLKLKNYNYYQDLIQQRSKGKPIAYLLGKKYFWKYEFQVRKNVLIPRPDTEIIIDQILKITKFKSKLNILDIGVGSGCILLTILKEKKIFMVPALILVKNVPTLLE